MPELVITRGLPASGKSTYARAWAAEDPTHRTRINRDDYRDMMFGGYTGVLEHELAVTKASDAAVAALLDKGYSVVMDNTFLPQRHARDARMLALRHGAEFRVVDFTHVGVDVCLERDAARIARGDRGVGEDVIRTMHHKFLRGKPSPLPLPEEPNPTMPGDLYIPDTSLPEAYIVDIDGTVAHMIGRSPYDETRVNEDRPNEAVIKTVQRLWSRGIKIVFVSGRHNVCEAETRKWINEHVEITYDLFMRKDGDNRKDYIVKREIFDAHIRNTYNVEGCFDDRKQVVEMYRTLGLTVYQVAEGNF